MGSMGSPIPSIAPKPNDIGVINTHNYTKDGCFETFICSITCPQWCIVPPPPDNDSGINFSPLIIALIAILGAGFLLIIYYFCISKYCKRRRNRDHEHDHQDRSSDDLILEEESNLNHLVVLRSGLDDGSIESITVFKYKKGDGLVESTECAVCLSEFKEDESLRLLPNCSHAFHIHCIDVWLKSHSNCPLCRANGDPFLPQPPSHQVHAL